MNSSMEKLISEYLSYFEEYLDKYCKTQFNDDTQLNNAIKYALFSGGKRIRPLLCFSTANFLSIPKEKVVNFALAIEFIHTYSLIHDDLPCMDNDDFRRGKPTVHKFFNEGIALLAGDTLLNSAYEILFSTLKEDGDTIDAVKYISNCAGINGMIGGQALEFESERFNEDTITEIALKKTGALISASIMSVALISMQNDKILALSTFAKALGLGFQIADDLIDKTKSEPNSFLSIIGYENTLKKLNDVHNVAIKTLNKWQKEAEMLLFLCKKLKKRTI